MRRLLLPLALTLAAVSPAGAATLVADYRFQDDTESNLAGLPSPTLPFVTPHCGFFGEDVLGHGTRRVHSYCLHQGLSLPMNHVDPGGWSVVFLARVLFADGYRRLLDTSEGSRDSGLYTVGGRLVFYPVASDPLPTLLPGAYHQVAITRDAATRRVAVYVDGVRRLAFDDAADLARVTGWTGRLFLDDNGEDQSGIVARLRVWDGALSADEVAHLSTVPDTQAPSVSVLEVSRHADNRFTFAGAAGGQPGGGTVARDLPVDLIVRRADGSVAYAGQAAVSSGNWRHETLEALPPGSYRLEATQGDDDGNRGSAARDFSAPVIPDPPGPPVKGREGKPKTEGESAVWRTAETLRRWMHFLGEDALMDGLVARSLGSRHAGRPRAWLTFDAPGPGTLYVKIGRLARRSCCRDVVGWAQVRFPEAGERAFRLDRPVITARLPQGVEYWYRVTFSADGGEVVEEGSQREVLTWRSDCAFTPDDLRDRRLGADGNGCFVGNPCRLGPSDRRDPDETCDEYRLRQRVMRANRRARARAALEDARRAGRAKGRQP